MNSNAFSSGSKLRDRRSAKPRSVGRRGTAAANPCCISFKKHFGPWASEPAVATSSETLESSPAVYRLHHTPTCCTAAVLCALHPFWWVHGCISAGASHPSHPDPRLSDFYVDASVQQPDKPLILAYPPWVTPLTIFARPPFLFVQHSAAAQQQSSTAQQHSTAQHSTAQHSTAQHSTHANTPSGHRRSPPPPVAGVGPHRRRRRRRLRRSRLRRRRCRRRHRQRRRPLEADGGGTAAAAAAAAAAATAAIATGFAGSGHGGRRGCGRGELFALPGLALPPALLLYAEMANQLKLPSGLGGKQATAGWGRMRERQRDRETERQKGLAGDWLKKKD